MVPGEYFLSSGKTGGATRLTAGRVSTLKIQCQRRWKSDVFMMIYVRRATTEEDGLSRALASNFSGRRDSARTGGNRGGGGVRNNISLGFAFGS